MRILLFPQKLIVGGANLVGLDLAEELVRRGHEITVFAQDGPLAPTLEGRGFEYVEAPGYDSKRSRWPSPRTVVALRRVARRTRAELIHTYEWPAALEAVVGPYGIDGVPTVMSILAMEVPRFLPKHVPIIVGTRLLRDDLVRREFTDVHLLEPSVDLRHDDPGRVDPSAFRTGLGVAPDDLLVTIVSRLSGIKVASTRMAIDAVGALGRDDVRLAIAGRGSAADDLRRRGDEVNRRLGREAVTFVGLMEDPRPAYAAADVVLGMGSSAMRALAFAKPLVVVGERGYVELFRPESSGEFVVQGFWGIGDGRDDPAPMVAVLGELADPARRAELGAFGHRFVCDRFSLEDKATILERLYEDLLLRPPGSRFRRGEVASMFARLWAVRVQGWCRRRLRGIRQLARSHDT